MGRPKHFIVDFDSTLVRVEALDVLAAVIAASEPERAGELEAVRAITDRAMAGELDFTQALEQRLAVLRPRREHLPAVAERLLDEITPSAREQTAFFAGEDVYVLSGGFHEWIDPVAAALGIAGERVLANRFTFGADGTVTGFDRDNPLARSGGKAEAVRALTLPGEVVAVGDGWTDCEIRLAGAADRFYAFTEVVERPRVVAHADRVARSFGDLLRQEAAA